MLTLVAIMPSYLLERDWAEGRLRMFAIANVHAETTSMMMAVAMAVS